MVVRWKKSFIKINSALALLFMLCLTYPNQGMAFDLFGVHLWGEKKISDADLENSDTIGAAKYYKVDVQAEATITDKEMQKQAIKTAQSASSLVLDKKKPASGSAGLLAKARGDYSKILAAFYAEGRYGGTISIKVNGQEAADMPADTELPENSTISITVAPGPQYYYDVAQIDALPPLAQNKKNMSPLPINNGFKQGDVATSSSILKAETLAIDAWRQQSYAKAKIKKTEVVADHAIQKIEANIAVDQGGKAHYGPLNIRNVSKNPRMDMDYVLWMTGIKQGQDFDPDDINKANARLARLDVFRAANIREAENISPDGSLDLNLVTQERPLHRFGFGGVYSSIDGAGFEAYWLHRNLFGHAERLRFDAKMSGIGGSQSNSFDPANYGYLLGVNLNRPGVFTPDTDMIMALNAQREVLDNYTTTSFIGSVGYTHIFNERLSGRLYGAVAQIKSEDAYFGNRDFTTLGFLGGLLYDSRDNSSNAKKGFYTDFIFQPLYEAQYGNFIEKFTVEGRSYIALDSNKNFVLALRGKIGSIFGADAQYLPSNMLFFAGGGGSVRGYGYKNIGVKTETNDIIGGLSLAEGSVELRSMITDTIGLVGFVDAGVVGKESTIDFSEQTKLGVGLGVRYMTGLGPLRLDVATPLNRDDGDPKLGVYIGIGQAF